MKKEYKTLYVILGFIITCLFLFNRILRIRLPREIPYNLTELSFIALICTCCILLTLLIIILFKITPKGNIITNVINQSLKTFHKHLTYNVFPDRQGVIFQASIIEFFFEKPKSIVYVFIITKIIQVFFLIVLFTEVFIYKKISVFYLLSPALAIVLLFQYLVFLLAIILEERLKIIDERVVLIYVKHGAIYYNDYLDYAKNRKIISAQEWINELKLKELNLITYDCDIKITIKEQYIQSLHPLLSIKEARKNFNGPIALKNIQNSASLAAYCSVILYRVNLIKDKYDKFITIMLLTTYLIIWLYVLIKSIHTLPDDTFSWLKYLMPKYENPFT